MFLKIEGKRVQVRNYRTRGDISDEVREMIETADEGNRWIAMDLEYNNGVHPKKNKIVLCQFTSPTSGPVLVRIHDGIIPKNIVRLLENESVLKIMHYAFGDGSFLRYHWRADLRNFVCTKIAVRILEDERIQSDSLQYLVDHFMHIKMAKELQTSDWCAKDFTKEQLEYATLDVMYLHDLWTALSVELFQRGKWEQVMLACDCLLEAIDLDLKLNGLAFEMVYPYKPRIPKAKPVKEESGNGHITKKQLFVPVDTSDRRGHPSAANVHLPVI